MGASAEDLDTLLHALDIVGARRVVLCSGTYSDSPADPHDRNGTPEALDALHAFVGDVLARTKARNFQLVFEPNPFHVLSSPERAIEFHSRLSDVERTHVRYVLDGASMILASNWEERNMLARAACEQLGEIAGIAYLRDAAIDETAGVVYPAPGEGGLDYPQYASAMVRHAGGAGAVIRSATPDRFADARDFMLRLGAWELA
jgi:sugar phosphate isomerase/epimerase